MSRYSESIVTVIMGDEIAYYYVRTDWARRWRDCVRVCGIPAPDGSGRCLRPYSHRGAGTLNLDVHENQREVTWQDPAPTN